MRAQSHVVGVALMLGVAVLALGTLTAGVGTLIDSQTAGADAERVAAGFDEAIQPERTGYHSHEIHFAEGQLETRERTLRVLENDTVIAEVAVDALIYENSDRRVVSLAGAVIRDSGASASFAGSPPIRYTPENEVLVVSAPALNAGQLSISGGSGVRKALRTNVTHDRRTLGTGQFAVAVETRTPDPFERYFEEQGADVEKRAFAGDSVDSVVASYPDDQQGYLVVHNLRLEVTDA